MSKVYSIVRRLMMEGGLDLSADDIRVALLMEGTSADAENAAVMTDFSVLAEFNGDGYGRGATFNYALSNLDVSLDLTIDRMEFNADSFSWAGLGNGTDKIAGVLLYKYLSNFNSSIPLAFFNDAPFPVDPSALNFSILWDTTGLLQLSNVGSEVPEKPGIANTGPATVPTAAYTGSLTLTADVTISDKIISGSLQVQPNITVTIENCLLINGGTNGSIDCINGGVGMGSGSLTVNQCELHGANYGVRGSGVTVSACNIHDITRVALFPTGAQSFTGNTNWIHHLGVQNIAAYGLSCGELGGALTVYSNFFDMPVVTWEDGTPNPNGPGEPYNNTGCIRIRADNSPAFPGPITPVLIDSNWFNGGTDTLRFINARAVQPVQNVTLTNNKFGCDYSKGLLTTIRSPYTPLLLVSGNQHEHNSENIDLILTTEIFDIAGSGGGQGPCYESQTATVVTFDAEQYLATAGGADVLVRLHRTGDTSATLLVYLELTGLSSNGNYTVTWPGNQFGRATFGVNRDTVDIIFSAAQSSDEGIATFTLEPDSTYEIGDPFRTNVSIQTSSGSTSLTFDGSGQTSTLVQYAFPIAPSAALPTIFIGDREADVFPVAWDRDDNIDWVQAVALIPTTTSTGQLSTTVTSNGTVPLPLTDQFNSVDLSGMELVVEVASIGTMRATLVEANDANAIEVNRNGKYISEKTYFSRLDSGGTKALAIHTFLARRADGGITFSLLISNDIYDPESAAPNVEHAEVDGDLHFQEMHLEGVPAGYNFYSDLEDASMDTTNGAGPIVVKDTGKMQIFPGRSRFVRHYGMHTNAAAARRIAEFSGFAAGHDGPFSHHSHRGYGGQRDVLPKLNDNYIYYSSSTGTNDNITGYTAARAMDQGIWNSMVGGNRLKNGEQHNTEGFERAQEGWFFPQGPSRQNQTGGPLVYLTHGWRDNPYEWRYSRLRLSYGCQRHTVGHHHPVSGKILTAIAQSHNGELDFAVHHSAYRHERWHPHFIDENAHADGDSHVDWRLKPFSRPWNVYVGDVEQTAEPSGKHAVQPFDHTDFWSPYTGAHHPRYTHSLLPLTYICNEAWAKWLLRQEVTHTEMGYSRLPSSYFPGSTYGYNSSNPNASIDQIIGAGHYDSNGGYDESDAGNGHGDWSRTSGHLFSTLAHGVRIISPNEVDFNGLNRRSMLRLWSNKIAEWGDYILSASGVGARDYYSSATDYDNFPGHPNYGPTDKVNGTGAFDDTMVAHKGWMIGFSAYGCYGLEQTLRPRSSAGPTNTDDPLNRVIEGSFERLYTVAETHPEAGPRPEAMYHYPMLLSDTEADRDTPSPTELLSWRMGDVHFGGYNRGYLDRRSCAHFCTVIWTALDRNEEPRQWLYRLSHLLNRHSGTDIPVPTDATYGDLYDVLMHAMTEPAAIGAGSQAQTVAYSWALAVGAVLACINRYGADRTVS